MLPVNAGPRTATVTLVRTQTLARPSAAARQAAEPAPTVKPSPRVISKPIGRANGCINQSPEHQRSRSNRHSSLHPHPKPARDFVPWRFSDAGRFCAWIADHPGVRETCTGGDNPDADRQHSCGLLCPGRTAIVGRGFHAESSVRSTSPRIADCCEANFRTS